MMDTRTMKWHFFAILMTILLSGFIASHAFAQDNKAPAIEQAKEQASADASADAEPSIEEEELSFSQLVNQCS